MCQQCQGHDEEDDLDALAHAFLQRQASKSAPRETYALLDRKAAPSIGAAEAMRKSTHA